MSYVINPFFVVPSTKVLDGVANITAAWSMSRDLLTTFVGGSRYTDVSSFVSSLNDQTGNARHLTAGVGARPAVGTGGPNNIASANFDGTNDALLGTTLSSFIGNAAGWMLVAFTIDTITLNDANPYENHPIIGDAGGYQGIYIRNTGTPKTAQAYNYDGNNDIATSATISASTAHVVEWWHTGGNLFVCVNNGTPVSVASGNTSNLTNAIGLGHAYTGSSAYLTGKVFEAVTATVVPATRSTIAADCMTQCGAV